MAIPDDDHRRYDLHHHHVGGQPGSWQHHERLGERRASVWHQLTQRTQAVLGIRDFAQGRTALSQYFTHFTRAQTQGHVSAFASDQLSRSTSGTSDLSTFARLQFDAVNGATYWDVAQLQGVTGLDWGQSACDQLVASNNAFRGDDVTTLAVCIAQQGDVSSTVRVVFDTLDGGWDAIFVVATEVNQTVMLLMTTTNVTSGDAAIVVTTTRLRFFSISGA